MMGFKDNLKSELAYKNIMVKELAALTGISKGTLDNYLNIRANIPPADVAVKIARALGVTVEYLVAGEEITPVKSSISPEISGLIQNFKFLSAEDRKIIVTLTQLIRDRDKKAKN